LLRAGFGFWSTIGMGIVVTVALYLLTAWILAKAGIFI
jgi:hypothetical protein